jgi:predicted dehydrogenase
MKTFRQQTGNINGIREINCDDLCLIQMELPNVLCSINLNSFNCRNGFEQDVCVSGEQGSLKVTSNGDLILIKRKGNESEFKEEKLYVEIQDLRQSESFGISRQYIKGMSKIIAALKESFTATTNSSWSKEFIKQASDFTDELYIQCIIEALKTSSSNRTWCKVELPADLRS